MRKLLGIMMYEEDRNLEQGVIAPLSGPVISIEKPNSEEEGVRALNKLILILQS